MPLSDLAETIVAIVMSDLSDRHGVFDGIDDDILAEISVDLNIEILAALERALP